MSTDRSGPDAEPATDGPGTAGPSWGRPGRPNPRLRTRQQLLATLSGGAPHTLRELVEHTGLSRGTVVEALRTLQDEGRVESASPTHATRGRPAATWRVTTRDGLVASLILDCRTVIASVADSNGDLLEHHLRQNASTDNVAEHVEASARWLADTVAQHRPEQYVQALAVGVDGFVTSTADRSDRRPHHRREVLVAAVREGFPQVGSVVVDTVVQLAAIGEHAYGAARGVDSALYVRVGDSVGGAVIIDRVLYRGSGGTAGDIGHHPAVARGGLCRCGARGCLETVASSLYLEQELRGGGVTGLTPGPGAAGPGVSVLERELLVGAGRAVGEGVGHAALVIDPQIVVLSVETPHAQVVSTAARSTIRAMLAPRATHRRLRVVPAELGAAAASRGGIARAARVVRIGAQRRT